MYEAKTTTKHYSLFERALLTQLTCEGVGRGTVGEVDLLGEWRPKRVSTNADVNG